MCLKVFVFSFGRCLSFVFVFEGGCVCVFFQKVFEGKEGNAEVRSSPACEASQGLKVDTCRGSFSRVYYGFHKCMLQLQLLQCNMMLHYSKCTATNSLQRVLHIYSGNLLIYR